MRPDLQEILEFVGELPIRKIPHIGGMKETTLQAMGIKKGKDLRERACDIMIAFLEHEHTFLIRCGLGISQTTHDTEGVDDD